MCFGRFFSSKPKKPALINTANDPFAAHLPPSFYAYLCEQDLLDGEIHTLNSTTEPAKSYSITIKHLKKNQENTMESVLINFRENHSQIESSIYFQNQTFLFETISTRQGSSIKIANQKISKRDGLTEQECEQYMQRLQHNIFCKISLAIKAKPLPQVKIKLS